MPCHVCCGVVPDAVGNPGDLRNCVINTMSKGLAARCPYAWGELVSMSERSAGKACSSRFQGGSNPTLAERCGRCRHDSTRSRLHGGLRVIGCVIRATFKTSVDTFRHVPKRVPRFVPPAAEGATGVTEPVAPCPLLVARSVDAYGWPGARVLVPIIPTTHPNRITGAPPAQPRRIEPHPMQRQARLVVALHARVPIPLQARRDRAVRRPPGRRAVRVVLLILPREVDPGAYSNGLNNAMDMLPDSSELIEDVEGAGDLEWEAWLEELAPRRHKGPRARSSSEGSQKLTGL